MDRFAFREDLNITKLPDYVKRKIEFNQNNPFWFKDVGTMIFCGHQGAGKTLSAVNYVYNLFERYPYMIVVSNIRLTDYPFNCGYRVNDNGTADIFLLETGEVLNLTDWLHAEDNDIINGKVPYVCIEYDGLDCLKYVCNNELGVVFLVDELHLELNSLESKNIDIDVIVEISQQRKQRKKIIGTSQVYMRLAKPLREQIFDVVICRNFFDCLQFNKSINGETAHEENGKLIAETKARSIYFHTFEMYGRYDTYAKMKRYNKEWQGHKRDSVVYGSTPQLQLKKAKGVNFG